MEFYWHDYETFGTDPRRDRPAQFAGVRTDQDFNIIGEPQVIYCRPPLDYLPQPESCLITGITPQVAAEKGLPEAEFIALIHGELAKPDTCALGYNSLRFDDEVTRNCLYRNFHDPYAREWQHGNSRWDLLDALRAARALRPDGIQWPVGEDGLPTLRLERLTAANHIAHAAAHDALSDVRATIAVARLLRQAQPKLYQFLFANRGKHEARRLLRLGEHVPVVHVSGRYPAANHNLAVVVALCGHPGNGNGVLVYDLSVDPEPLLTLPVRQIKARVFTATASLPESVQRVPLKTVHLNKCPVLAPVTVLKDQDLARLAIDLGQCQRNLEKIKACPDVAQKVAAVFADSPQDGQAQVDPDLAIYSGGFFSEADKQQMAKVRQATPVQLAGLAVDFADRRLPEMLFRYRARNYPQSLAVEEQARWRRFCAHKLAGAEPGLLNWEGYWARLDELDKNPAADPKLLAALRAYGQQKMAELAVGHGAG